MFSAKSSLSLGEKQKNLQLDEDMKVIAPELLRAAPARLLFRSFGAIFRCSAGTAASFDLSRPTDSIHAFLSHSWRTPGYLKTLALMYHYNVRLAILASVVVSVLICGVEIAIGGPFMPIVQCYVAGMDGEVIEFRFGMSFVPSCFVFLCVLTFGQEWRLGREVLCFLDKCCIHQTDEDLKQKGIKQLGAFLCMSDKMVLLWQPEYFTRLWCVYELAAFNYIHKGDFRHIEFVPLKLPILCISLFCFHMVASAGLLVVAPLVLFSRWHEGWVADSLPQNVVFVYHCGFLIVAFFAVFSIPSVILWKFCQWHMEDRTVLLRQVSEFRVASAECFVPSDRVFVEGKIQSWFGSIDAFERVVRTNIAQLVSSKLEAQGPVPWKTICVGSLPHLYLSLEIVALMVLQGDWEMMVRLLLLGLSITFFTDAIAIALTLRLAHRLRGTTCGSLTTATTFSVVVGVSMAQISPGIPLWGAGVLDACLVGLTILLFCKLFPSRRVLGKSDAATSVFANSQAQNLALKNDCFSKLESTNGVPGSSSRDYDDESGEV